jgi:hypothetical protein
MDSTPSLHPFCDTVGKPFIIPCPLCPLYHLCPLCPLCPHHNVYGDTEGTRNNKWLPYGVTFPMENILYATKLRNYVVISLSAYPTLSSVGTHHERNFQ